MTTGRPAAPGPRRERPWRTLRGRLILGSLAGLLAASLVFAIVSSSLVRSESERNAREDFDAQAIRLAQLISSRFSDNVVDNCETYRAADLSAFIGPGTRMFVTPFQLCASGRDDIPPAPEEIVRRIDEAEIIENGFQRIDDVRLGRNTDTVVTVAGLRLDDRPQIVSFLILAKPREEVQSSIADVVPRLFLATAIGFIPALLLSLLLTTRLTRPIRQMRAATDRVAGGDLSAEVGHSGTADLDALADDFNVMVARLRERDRASRDFLMKITHDLRTPLTAVRGHAAALADGIVPEEQRPRSLAAIESEAARLEEMVTDLLDLARIDADRFTTAPAALDPGGILEQAVDAHSADAALRGIRLDRRIEPLPEIVTDGGRLRQIIDNLVDNALRWTPDGGAVAVVGEPRAEGGIRVAVSDTGPGVAPALREEIFEPFRSSETPEGRTGTGLGLAICRQLARALGGDVIVGDGPGGGAAFVLTLPPTAPVGSPAAPAPAPSGVS